ncbi:MAG: hypothetical protein V3U96_09400 [Paracoccaceae bacterium]
MDVKAFLEIRTDFIGFYYSEAVKPFFQIQNAIENEKTPYDNPPYDESGEPPFQIEWFDAQHGVEFVGLNCVSLLSDSLKLFFETLFTRVLGLKFNNAKNAFKGGFVRAYKNALSKHLTIDWVREGVDFDLIEQVVLARNNAQHGEYLSDLSPYHNEKVLKKFPSPIFTDPNGLNNNGGSSRLFPLRVHVSKVSLTGAISEITKMAEVIDKKVYSRG